MQRVIFALMLAALTAGPVAASDKSDLHAVVHQFVDAFNKGDTKAALASCASVTSLLDDLPPHEWHGEGACARWFSDFEAFNKAQDITPETVTLGAPRHVDITGEHAYLVVPTTYTFKKKGKSIKQSGSIITIALQKDASGWHMTGWAWADGTDAEVKAEAGK